MDNLPLELLVQCMSYLSCEEKMTCLHVNKLWSENVRKIAYETVAVASPEQFAALYTFFDGNEDCGKLVKNLFIIDCHISEPVYFSLPTLFPNIKKFYVKDNEDYAFPATRWNTVEAKTQFTMWKDTIEDVTEVGSPICTEALLTEGACPNWKSLELASLGMASGLDRIKFIKKLKVCAPNLTHLKLLYMGVDLKTMETLLKNTPNLKALSFTEVGFLESKKFDLSKVKAHPGLETLSIREGSFCDAAKQWITYFSKKFIHLKNLCINKMEDNYYEGFCDKYDKQLVEWVSKLSKLEYYRVQAFILTKNIVKAMDQSGMQLKRIDLGRLFAVDKFFKWLANSNQKTSLETISSVGQPYGSIIYEFKNFTSKLAEFTNLKHLTIFHDQNEIDLPNKVPLDQFLKYIPNLETLKMDFGEYVVEYDKDEPMPDCKLKELVLIEFNFNAVNRFKDTEEGHLESWEYVENTVLPNTKFITRELEEPISIEESHFLSICDYKEYNGCEYDIATYEADEM
ncbi:unnamed protein product [Mucor hiemalis]